MTGLERAQVLRQAVSLRWEDRCGFECLPWSATILDLGAQVQVKAGCGQIEWRVRSCENDAAGVENGRYGSLFILEVGKGRSRIGLLSGGEGKIESCVLPGWGDGAARICRQPGVVGILRLAEGSGDGPHARLREQSADVGITDPCERPGVGPASPGSGAEVAHAVFAEGDRWEKIMRGGFNAHLRVGELNSLLRPSVWQADIQLHKVEVQRLEPVELPVELGFAGSRDHH